MSRTTLDLTVTADARAAQRGLQGLSSSLQEVTQDAARTEAALSELDNPITVTVNDEAIQNARQEISRLQAQMAEQIRLDVNADTREVRRRLSQLRASIRELERNRVDIDVDVDTDDLDDITDSADGARRSFSGLGDSLGSLAQKSGIVLGSLIGVLAAVATGAGAVGAATIGMADEFDNAKIAFTQFLGGADEATKFLNDLAQFAAKTPFEFKDLVGASKTLLAFGLRGEDVVKTMGLLGDAAALTGSEVGDLTEIWGEMVAVGEIGNDTLLELTNNGIPAYKILAQEMGKTPGQISKMAEEGKLLVKNVLPKLERGLERTFGGGMGKQAETLTGKISTLKDSLATAGLSLGQALLPFATALTDKIQPALDDLAGWAKDNRGEFATIFAEAAADVLEFVAVVLDGFAALSDGVATFAAEALIGVGKLGQAVSELPGWLVGDVDENLGDAWVAAGEDMKAAVKDGTSFSNTVRDMAKDARDAAGDIRDFGKDVSDSLELDTAKANLADELAALAELKTKAPTVKVEADITAARQRISALRAEIDAETDKQRLIGINVRVTSKREELHAIDDALENLRNKKVTPQVKAEIKEWTAKRKQVATELETLKKQQATVKVDANTSAAKEKLTVLNQSLNTTTQDRDSRITVTTSGVGTADSNINDAARDRTSTIHVRYDVTNDAPGEHSGGRSATGQSIVPQLFGPSTTATVAGLHAAQRSIVLDMSGGTQAQQRVVQGRTVTQLRPKEVPIKVYLDGAEIADHLQLKAGRMATATSVRRRA